MTDEPANARSLPPGTRLGRYRVVKRIGVGGMAELYLALADGAQGFEKLVVLKLVHAHLAGDRKLSQMLLKEARVAATLDHPNIVSVIDVGTDEGEHYLVMEYVHGRDVRAIQERLPRGQPLPLACALEIVRCACQALHYAHTRCDLDGKPLGLVHRDVSPSNVLVSYGGAVALVDFGIAKVGGRVSTTQTGVLKGKFGYMSPEQSLGQTVDCRSDVFALGILLYELTVGRRAFMGPNPFAIMNKAIAADYVPPERVRADYPARLASVIARAMKPKPDERYQTAAAMQADLDSFALDSRLRLGEQVLRELMDELFGSAPFPVVTDLPDRNMPSLAVASVGDSVAQVVVNRRPWARWTAAAMVAAGAAFAGWWAGSSQEPRPAPADPQPVPAAMVEPPTNEAPREPTDREEPSVGAASVDDVPNPTGSAESIAASEAAMPAARTPARPAPRKTKAKRSRRDRSAPPDRDSNSASPDALEGMLPPSMQ